MTSMSICPIRLGGEKAGELRVERQGPWTVFAARCRDDGRLLRLSVYGGGREGYLGVLIPERGELRLTKRLSRAAMADFPERIEYAAEAGAAPGPAPPPAEEPPLPPVRGRETETLWYAVGDGTLYTCRADGAFRAVPLIAGALPPGAAERRAIEGVEYALFPVPP